ncbi:YceI family protein [Pseudobacteriovorax antillogorgiicola]|uniref:YceI-like domain-containing protein n=1 Tax=Pseudobacteriovorax antillogorgiicola TaxID=1513793 RepID=A0A1Y6C7X4_9BACT|nr:YceI family protein [Pseudobacteriovorax antillogorgiicola]TCS49344.1 YceI-like domain-containing protein [Pseudobacteriovorax antillogorgiicola]SMF47683.1 YceI-like domain-containing protein [Pseudobacteriovorax antillogorgiicola]
MKKKTIIPAIIILFMISTNLYGSTDGNWVSWGAKKTMFLFNDKTAIGMNKNINAKLDKSNGTIKLKMSIPLDKFDSGEPDRDAEVVKMLKGDVSKNLMYESETFSPEKFEQLRNGQTDQISGKLKIGNKWFDVVFAVKIANNKLSGQVETKLTEFGIEPPSMVGGIMVSVKDYIALKVNLDLSTLPH